MDTVTGVTTGGFSFSVSKDVMDNMELVDALAETTDDNPLAISKVGLLILGADQRKALYNSLRTEDGRVPTEAVGQALADIMKAFGEQGKN